METVSITNKFTNNEYVNTAIKEFNGKVDKNSFIEFREITYSMSQRILIGLGFENILTNRRFDVDSMTFYYYKDSDKLDVYCEYDILDNTLSLTGSEAEY